MKLYVGNLAFETSSQELQELFAQAGTVESASVVKERDTGRVQGRAILLGGVTEVQNTSLMEDQDTNKQVKTYFAQIAESRKRSHRLQTEIARIKKKSRAIIDKLP